MGHLSRLAAHRSLFLILLIFTGLTIYNSVTLPLGEAADETDHYQYLRFVARTGRPPLTQADRQEAGFKGGLAPLYYWLTAWPIALVGEKTQPDIRRVDARPERHIPTDGLGINHVLHTLDEQWPWQGQVLAWHLVRFLSLPMAWITLVATYALTRRLVPEQKIVAIGAAAFVAFLPRFVISSAVINDDNLIFALTALLLLNQVVILQGNQRPLIFGLFGALFGLALVSKYFSLILVPEVLFTLFVYRLTPSLPSTPFPRKTTHTTHHASRITFHVLRSSPYLFFIITLIITAAPWFTFIILRFNRINELGLVPGLAASLGEPQITEGLVGLLAGRSVRPPAATYSLLQWTGLLYRSFWFEYGWMQLFAPGWVYLLFTIFLVAVLIGLIKYLKSRTALVPPAAWLLGLHFCLFAVVVLARYILSATIDTSQGRHLYPALPVIAMLVSLGLLHFRLWMSEFGSAYAQLSATLSSLLLATCYLLPASLTLLPPIFILPHYRTLPVTITPPSQLPINHRYTLRLADGLELAGLDLAPVISAGQALPVSLYWHARREADQDYLISLCLQNREDRPVACWRGHFVDGHYPARAWEAGDTVVDTVYIPIPTCDRLHQENGRYNLRLEVWPVMRSSPMMQPEESPISRQTFAEPLITILATDPAAASFPQAAELWLANQRLTAPTQVVVDQSLAQITYTMDDDQGAPVFENPAQGKSWLPVDQFSTPLFLPCEGRTTPYAYLAHFISDPTLAPGIYRPHAPNTLTNIAVSLSTRLRDLEPIQASLSFASYLSPLHLQLAGQPNVNLSQIDLASSQTTAHVQLTATDTLLPVTIRWQARRWMADPLVVSLKLLDQDFVIVGERIATLGDRYPNVLWVPTEVVEETYPIEVRPAAPPGLYRLELSLVHQNENLPSGFEYLPVINGETNLGVNLYPATVRLLDPAHDIPPTYVLSAQLGEAIQLIGYSLDQSPILQRHSGQISSLQSPIFLALYWQSKAKISTDYTVFTQLVGPDGQVWAQWDNPPQAGRYPTTAWEENDAVVDRYTLRLRQGAPSGQYRLLVGMYHPSTGQRLPVTVDERPQPDQAVELTKFSLAP